MLSKRNLTFTIFCIFSLLLGQFVTLAQRAKSGVLYDRPARLVLNGVGEQNREDKDGYVPLLTESFYPIGFSKDGKFAYYVEPVDEACGCYIAELVIQDLRTDKILFEHKYMGDGDNDPADETIKTYWNKNQKEFSRKLAQHGIRAQKRFLLKHPSIRHKRDLFSPKLKVNIKTDDVYEVEGEVTLEMFSKRSGKKIVYQKKYDPDDVNGFRDAEISGVLKSPFEARTAIVMVETHRGWEGLPQITRIKIVGSDLTSRFRR